MMSRGDTSVLVLAAGPGTRMRSDTPKVLHHIAGRSMLSHSLHAITKLAPQHVVAVLGHDHQRIAPIVADLADALGRTIDVALQDRPLGTGHAVLCGLSALPDDYAGIVVVTSGDTPLLDADTLADLIASHSAVSAAVTVLTTTLADPSGYGRILRTQDDEVMAIVEHTDATPSQRQIREVNAGVYAFDIAALRSALSRLSSNNAQQELYLTDVVAILRQDGQTVHSRHVDDSALVAGVNNRVQLAELGAELNRRIVAAHQMAGVTDRRPRHHLDRRRRHDRPRHRRPPRNPAARAHPDRRSLCGRPGYLPDRRHRRRRRLGGPHPRRLVVDR